MSAEPHPPRRPRRPRRPLRWDPAIGTANLALFLLFLAVATRWRAWADGVGSMPLALAITAGSAAVVWIVVFAAVRLVSRVAGRRGGAGD